MQTISKLSCKNIEDTKHIPNFSLMCIQYTGRHTGGRHTEEGAGHGNAGTGTSTGAGRLGLLHLQSMLLATDTVGMGAMLRKGVFECHANKWDTIVHR